MAWKKPSAASSHSSVVSPARADRIGPAASGQRSRTCSGVSRGNAGWRARPISRQLTISEPTFSTTGPSHSSRSASPSSRRRRGGSSHPIPGSSTWGPALAPLAEYVFPDQTGNQPVTTEVFDLEGEDSLPSGPFDLIIACHSVNELWKGRSDALERRAALLERATAELRPGGILLIVEPSAQATSIPALQLRDILLKGSSGLACAAPCPDSHPCPAIRAGEGRTCHSTWPWTPPSSVAALAAEAGLDRDSAKATWFALVKIAGGSGGRDPVTWTEDGETSVLSGRVVSEPLLNKAGRIRFIICAGKALAAISAPAASVEARAAGFFGLARGDCFRAEGLSRRPGELSFGFERESRLFPTFKAPEVL
ncbi:MAG: hypothetical protein NT061_01140 [Spirochaetes bacterium]|nr:hypothetical protein [Spirochaetota bacterium]